MGLFRGLRVFSSSYWPCIHGEEGESWCHRLSFLCMKFSIIQRMHTNTLEAYKHNKIAACAQICSLIRTQIPLSLMVMSILFAMWGWPWFDSCGLYHLCLPLPLAPSLSCINKNRQDKITIRKCHIIWIVTCISGLIGGWMVWISLKSYTGHWRKQGDSLMRHVS